MNHSFHSLNEIKSFDIIFIGQLASVTAHLFAVKTNNRYKTLVLSKLFAIQKETQQSIIETSLLPICTDEIKAQKKLKHSSVRHMESKVVRIRPKESQIETQSGRTFDYKYLLYSGNTEDWADYDSIKKLPQALQNDYSLVYSNIRKREITSIYKKDLSDNIVFYIPNCRHSGYDNYNFFLVHQKIMEHSKSRKQEYCNKPLKFKIILEGKQFFPHCREADEFIKKEVSERGFEVQYDSNLTKVDYLRRILTINDSYQLPYNVLYCIIPHKVPQILQQASIDPYFNSQKTLQNKKFPNIFVFGADIFPTTHTFQAIQYQNRIISHNLDHLLSHSGEICLYSGRTLIPVYISNSQVVTIKHHYRNIQSTSSSTSSLKEDKGSLMSENCSWLKYYVAKLTKSYLTECYYNYNSTGSPYYIFTPAIKSVKLQSLQSQLDNHQQRVSVKSDARDKQEGVDVNQVANHTAYRLEVDGILPK